MRSRTVLVLLLVVGGLASFIWFVERDRPSTDERAEQGKKLVVFDVDAVTRIELERGSSRIELDTTAGVGDGERLWRISHPVAGRADQDKVEDLLGQIVQLEKSRTFDDVPAGEVGLDTPRGRVVVSTETEDLQIRLGSSVPASGNTVVDLGPGSAFFVVTDSLWTELDREVDHWRSRDALAVESDRISEIEIEIGSEGGRIVLARVEDGFDLAEPIADRAAQDEADQLLRDVANLQIERFLGESEEALGLDAPRFVLTLRLEGEQDERQVVVGEPVPSDSSGSAGSAGPAGSTSSESEGEFYVRAENQAFVAKIGFLDLLERSPAEWQSRKWTDRRAVEVQRLEIEDSRALTILERSSGEWLRDGLEIPYEAASDVVYEIVSTEGLEVVPRAAVDSSETELTVRIGLSDETVEELQLLRSAQGLVAVREGREFGVVLSDDVFVALRDKLQTMRAAVDPADESAGADG